ncbi:uncharacterized protein LOC112504054 [Cynara cardunculus var. scolymus]|uniref:uncharacterized protein LOC112504054 n=1 Tax=Cynara cardunculus var. scolymus TaxID=59895 RepID=UPI000D62FB81|nr:uncharacterized protein LOC112504054 [Cynara cardunculus var. scolymus]
MCSMNIIQILYDIFFNLSLDYSLIFYTDFKATVAKKCQEVAKGRELPSLLFLRFLGLLLRHVLDDNNIDVGRLPVHKVNVLTRNKPTVNKEGYAAERPIPKMFFAYMKTKEVTRAYRHACEALDPVPRTPSCIGIAEEEERTEETLRPQAEEEAMRLEKEREKQIRKEEAKKKRMEREQKKKEEEARVEQESEGQEEETVVDSLQGEPQGSARNFSPTNINQVVNEGFPRTRSQSAPCVEPEVTQPAYITREEFQSLVTSLWCSLEELKLIMDHAEPSPSASALDEIQASLAVLRVESLMNVSRLHTLPELTARNAEALQKVIASMQRGEASTSHDAHAIIPLNVPIDYVTQGAMNALGDRLL